jgi:hypothetical protein
VLLNAIDALKKDKENQYYTKKKRNIGSTMHSFKFLKRIIAQARFLGFRVLAKRERKE